MNKGYERASNLLEHYLETAFRAAGLSWGIDNSAEVAEIVDQIVDTFEKGDAELAERIEAIERAISQFGNQFWAP